jgi:single-strand DNA-binding protein
MAGLNKISLIGNLGKDPEVRYTPDGLAVTNFSIAVSEKFKEKGESKERTTWFRVSAFGKLGEICGEYLSKGKQVYVEGRLHTSEWKDKDGNNRFSLEVAASQMVMLGQKGDSYNTAETSGYEKPASSPAKPRPSVSENTGVPGMPQEPHDTGPQEDDIPF